MEERTGLRAALAKFLRSIPDRISKAFPITPETGIAIKVKTAEGWKVVDTGVESITFTELDEKYGSGNWALLSSKKEN